MTVRLMTRYCLKGTVDDQELSFVLQQGENLVGSLPSHAVPLATSGVSRRHAQLTLKGAELQVEDLGSKNGTFINNIRIINSVAQLEDELRFGPVSLRFEVMHQEDAELAFVFDAPLPQPTSSSQIQETPLITSGVGGAVTKHWLQVAEAFIRYLPRKAGGDIAPAVQALQEELGLQGICVLEAPERRMPVVLAASGQVIEAAVSEFLSILNQNPEGAAAELHFVAKNPADGLPFTLAALTQPQLDPLALAFSGTFGGRAESEALLRLLLRMLDHCRPDRDGSGQEPPRAVFPQLVVPDGFIFAQSESMRQLYSQMQTLAQGDLSVLVIGATGVGKEYLAQILHQSSKRRSGPFEAINCAAIPAELLESELFGIGEKVATGVSSRKGRFQLADGGTLFLDEIGDMSADLQAKLLRALQEREVNPVGERPVRVDVRVIAATNQELNQRIQDGSFRSDLYYRLAGYLLEVPPLCQRPEDIPDLVEHYLKDCAKQLDKTFRGMTIRALKMLVDYPWPGNVRELQNEVRRLVYLCPARQAIDSSHLSKTIQLHSDTGEHPATIELPIGDLPVGGASVGDGPKVDNAAKTNNAAKTDNGNAPGLPGRDTLKLGKIELQAIEEALRLRDGNQTKAAILLGITRQKLRRRMKIFGLL